ncbi:hypothetical protein Tdes44962_MAKER09691 [Teratosphaeria destructans]|uniref:Uncharacterized protein n=1 Tax=Teratosphaeria destructans TaxID=418781 RepID=A0A9W7W253_9PEZI|nr:hypothetical protein Tdes44962_MAKER09691 [Teratosphaeria destructans]
MSINTRIDLSRGIDVDETEFEDGFVLEPKLRWHKGVVVIDRNSLYSSIMSKVGVSLDNGYS